MTLAELNDVSQANPDVVATMQAIARKGDRRNLAMTASQGTEQRVCIDTRIVGADGFEKIGFVLNHNSAVRLDFIYQPDARQF